MHRAAGRTRGSGDSVAPGGCFCYVQFAVRVRALVSAAVIAFVPLARTQDTRGQILGRVMDAAGAVVVGAKVRALNAETNVATSAATNHTGDYVLPFLIPGTYGVSVEMEGFHRFLQEGITVQVDDKVTLNVKLEVGAVTESVRVVAEAPLMDSADASMGQVVDSRSITELPLKDGNPIMLAELSPGVSSLATGGMSRPFDNSNPSSITVNGVRTGGNEFSVDGAPNNAGTGGNVAYVPPSGTVSEFKIQTNTFDASYGFAPGANINVSLRSGANQLRGQMYHFVQNPAFNANAFFSNLAKLPKDDYRQNRWGANANGPLVIPRLYDGHSRTFWMYGYEGIRDSLPRKGAAGVYTVPTPAQREGDFSGLLRIGPNYRIFDPATIRPTSATRFARDPFPDNIIPASRINKTAQKVMARYFPAANLPGTIDGTQNYTVLLLEKNRFQNHVFRFDHVISDRHRLFVRGSYNDRFQENEQRFNGGNGINYWRENRGFGVDDVYVLSPRFLLNVRYSFTRYQQATDPVSTGLDITSLGFSRAFADQIRGVDPRGLMLPDINITNYPELNSQSRSTSANDIHALAFAFTRMVSSHTMHFGGEYRAYRDTSANMGRSSGKLDFGTNWTRGPNDNSSSAPLGQGLASFLLGLPTGGYMDVNGSYAQQYQVSGWYFQDAWKLGPRLTVNLGLRWEFEAPTTERFDRSVRGFDFTAPSPIEPAARANYALNPIPEIAPQDFRVPGGVTFAGVKGEPRSLWVANKHNLAPRAALAWQLNNRTVLRAGYGVFFDIARQSVNQTGFSRQTSLVASLDTGQTFVASLESPFPDGFNRPMGAGLGFMTNVGQSISAFKPALLDPYMQRWQASVQRRVGRQGLVEMAYVGNRGTHLRVTRELDGVPRHYLSTLTMRDNAVNSFLTANVPNPFYPLLPNTNLSARTVQRQQLLTPYPQFINVGATTNEGYSWFHSLQSRIDKRFANSYLLIASWTWSKFMEATSFLNETDAALTRAISDQDRSHRMVGSAIYELPFGRRKRWASRWRGPAGALASGWQAQGIYRWQSGAPLGFGNALFFGDIKDIPLARGVRGIRRWFNTDDFEKTSNRQLVYNIRTFPLRFSGVRAAGINMWDLSVSKNTRLRERVSTQFRAEFINALNHTHFASPNTSPSNTAFGTIAATNQMPRTIQFGLKIIY